MKGFEPGIPSIYPSLSKHLIFNQKQKQKTKTIKTRIMKILFLKVKYIAIWIAIRETFSYIVDLVNVTFPWIKVFFKGGGHKERLMSVYFWRKSFTGHCFHNKSCKEIAMHGYISRLCSHMNWILSSSMNTLLEQLMNNIQVGDDAKILAMREKWI